MITGVLVIGIIMLVVSNLMTEKLEHDNQEDAKIWCWVGNASGLSIIAICVLLLMVL